MRSHRRPATGSRKSARTVQSLYEREPGLARSDPLETPLPSQQAESEALWTLPYRRSYLPYRLSPSPPKQLENP